MTDEYIFQIDAQVKLEHFRYFRLDKTYLNLDSYSLWD